MRVETMMEELLEFKYQKDVKTPVSVRIAIVTFAVAAIFAVLPMLPFFGHGYTADAAVSATGNANATVNIRKSASTSSASLGTLKKGAKVTIYKEVFTSKKSTSSDSRWFQISNGGRKGYVKVSRVSVSKYSTASATTTDALNYRSGAGTSMKKLGTASYGTKVKVYLPAKAAGSSDIWYKVKVSGRVAYMIGDYLNIKGGGVYTPKNKKGLAGKLYQKVTNGGRARVVYTFDKKNCKKRFAVTGSHGNHVPQGLAYTGNKYFVIFGMSDGQSIVTYSSSGKRLKAVKFPYNMGHPNSLTWDPITKVCYIFRGYQYKCNTWNPVTNKFGSAKTPYSSSGIAYDSVTKKLYSSSKTGIRVYSPDGRFSHQKVFDRCSRSGKTYVQDCGAYGGFVFHAVSGANKHTTNYLDVYRALDGKYLASIKVNLGETESVVVNKNGYVELLINHSGTYTEYIWRTPLNVKDLM